MNLSIAQIRNALNKLGDQLFNVVLDFAPERRCELCGTWNQAPNVCVPGGGFYCIGCEAVIRESQQHSTDPEIQRLAAEYDARVAARAAGAAA